MALAIRAPVQYLIQFWIPLYIRDRTLSDIYLLDLLEGLGAIKLEEPLLLFF